MKDLKTILYSSAGKTIELPKVMVNGLTAKEEKELYAALTDVVFQFGYEFAERKRIRQGFSGFTAKQPSRRSKHITIDL